MGETARVDLAASLAGGAGKIVVHSVLDAEPEVYAVKRWLATPDHLVLEAQCGCLHMLPLRHVREWIRFGHGPGDDSKPAPVH